MPQIAATEPITQAPAWAVLQRRLISEMEAAVDPFLDKYTDEDGTLIWRRGPHGTRDGADDFYESFYNWPLLYLLGGSDRMLYLGKKQWEVTTRLLESMGHIDKEYEIGYDQFHQSESYIYFYLLCMADPRDPVQRRRATRFAGFYLGEDPDAPNYDPDHRIIRCVHSGSRGPRWLFEEDDQPRYGYAPGMAIYGLPFHDIDGIDTFDDLKDPANARRMGEAMKERMGKGDAAANLSVCSLIANAHLLTGDRKYRDWLVEYVGAWQERAKENGGLVPDNVGLSGRVGEYQHGRWYGSMYGWSWPHGFYNVGSATLIAGIATYVATGDVAWLDFPRSQLREIWKLGRRADPRKKPMSLAHHWTGQLAALPPGTATFVVPYRYTDGGWFDYQPLSPVYSATLWNVAGLPQDREMLTELRRRESHDWRTVTSFRSKEDAGHEQPWLAYLSGENPDYPEQILQVALDQVYRRLEQIRRDESDLTTVHIHHWQRLNPVTTEALIQLTLGAPQMPYNGGLLAAPIRHFDADARRPGLPHDVAALVDSVADDSVSLTVMNLNGETPRRLLIQAGSFGEHRFGALRYSRRVSDYPGTVGEYAAPPLERDEQTIRIDGPTVTIALPPGTQIHLTFDVERSVAPASYEFPWHREENAT